MALLAHATGRIFLLTNNCYSKFIFNYLSITSGAKNFVKTLSVNNHSYSVRLPHTDSSEEKETKKKYIKYDEVLAQRRLQAQKSILVEVQSIKSCDDAYAYCSQFGSIKKLFYYNTEVLERHFVLIEYESRENVKAVLDASTHINHDQIIPVRSSMLWFRNRPHRIEKKPIVNKSNVPLSKDSLTVITNHDLDNALKSCRSISEQIITLHNCLKLSDLGSRLRFYMAYQIECCFHSLFPNIAVLPFGSSVNGFGKQGCDLDLSAVFEETSEENNMSRLVFQSKSFMAHEKLHTKRIMETIADVISIFVPGISNVKKILGARVPIIKFDHTLTGIECDLTMSNMSGYYMSELLYTYGEIDPRVRPLIFSIRIWAEKLKLTTKISPGPWITNFSLTLMILFFLQEKKILPPLNLLKSRAKPEDTRVAESYIDCTFQRDVNTILKHNKVQNETSVGELLSEFFSYYGNFDFESKAISIREGKPISKPEYSALYISNPLETTLNVSQNVRYEELERIKVAMRSASWQLEAAPNTRTDDRGLLSLFKNTNFHSLARKQNQPGKSLNIAAIFENEETNTSEKKLSDKKRVKKNKTNVIE